MQVTSVQVEFTKMLSDGDYGHERAVASFRADLDQGEDPIVAAEYLLDVCVNRVYARLGDSYALKIRRALRRQTRDCFECHEPMDDFEPGQMHQACREKRALEQVQRRHFPSAAEESHEDHSGSDSDADEDLEDLPV